MNKVWQEEGEVEDGGLRPVVRPPNYRHCGPLTLIHYTPSSRIQPTQKMVRHQVKIWRKNYWNIEKRT